MLVLIMAPTLKPLAWADTVAMDTSRLPEPTAGVDSCGEQPTRASVARSKVEKNR
jgi:hypothetical protein